MFAFIKRLFVAKPHPATRRVMQSITSERERALTARDDNRTIAEAVAHLDSSRAPRPVHVPLPLDQDTVDRLRRKAENGGTRTPIWPVGCTNLVIASEGDLQRVRNIFEPCPIPPDVHVWMNMAPASDKAVRNVTYMVIGFNTAVIVSLFERGAHLINAWGQDLDMTGFMETDAERNGRRMKEAASQRETEPLPPVVWPDPVPLQAADLPDFHSCRYSEDPAFVGGGGSFGGGGASGGWDENNQTSPSYDSSSSCDSSTSDSGSCDSSTGGGD